MKKPLAILGFGAFGRFMAEHLREHFDVRAFDERDVRDEARALGVRSVSLEDACSSGVIVLAVPAQRLEALLERLGPHLPAMEEGATPLVLDVSSVKVRPIELMRRLLPRHVNIVGTHPLFGPQSGKSGIAGLPVALCPVRTDGRTTACVREFLAGTLGLRVVDVAPDEHDRQMAYVQGLTHMVSRVLGEMPLPETELSTVAYQRLLAMRSNLAQDSWDLFVTIENHNPFAGEIRERFQKVLRALELQLRNERS